MCPGGNRSWCASLITRIPCYPLLSTALPVSALPTGEGEEANESHSSKGSDSIAVPFPAGRCRSVLHGEGVRERQGKRSEVRLIQFHYFTFHACCMMLTRRG